MDTLTNTQSAIPDPRPLEEKQKDFTHEEILGGGIADWKELNPMILDIRSQITSSSCGGQSGAKGITSFEGIVCSAEPIYNSRVNYPDPGMYLQDIGRVCLKIGTGSEKDYPSQNLTEQQLNALKQAYKALPYGISAYYTIEKDMDKIAQALDKGHAVIIGLASNINEWVAVPHFTNTPTTFSHFVVSHSKNYGMHEGLKVIAFDDSCNLYSTYNQTGQRFITNDFLQNRVWGVMGLIPVEENVLPKPHCVLTKDLSLGMTDPQVETLQTALQYEGFFPKEIKPTKYFGQITKNALMKYQTKHKDFVLIPAGLDHATGFCGSFTRKFLASQYP